MRKKNEEMVEKKLHPNWLTMIKWCGADFQNGQITFTTEGAIPWQIIDKAEKVVFGKEINTPLFVKDLNASTVRIRVTKKWGGLIDWCVKSYPYGRVCVVIAAGEPVRPIEKYSKTKIDFGHPENFPDIVRGYE